MNLFKFTAYHGTDASVANAIMQGGFRCKSSSEHWLGEGIYLYLDRDLAKWWTSNPTKKHGVTVTKPAIVECKIEVDEEKVLDLRKLSDYKEYIDLYNGFFRTWTRCSKDYERVNISKLRCAFFNYMYMLYDVWVVIASFNLPDQPYIPLYTNKQYGEEMHIMYPEIQVRVSAEHQFDIIEKTGLYLL